MPSLITDDGSASDASGTAAANATDQSAADGGQQAAQADAGQGQGGDAQGQGDGKASAADGGQVQGQETSAGSEAGDAQGAKPEGEAGKDALGAPEAYADFTVPEGFQLEGALLESLTGLAKELNLPQDKAQQLVNLGVAQAQAMQTVQEESLNAARQAWAEAAQADSELGGENFQANLAVAAKGLKAYASPALIELLDTSGLGSHPEIIRVFHNIGQTVSEDTIVTGNGGERAQPTDAAKKLYPKMA